MLIYKFSHILQGDFWDKSVLPIGHIANYSALRELYPDKYHVADTYFGMMIINSLF